MLHSPFVHRFAPGATEVVPPPPAPAGWNALLLGPEPQADDLTDATAIFVDPSGSDGAPGTRAAPKATLAAGLSAAVSAGKANVGLAGGQVHRQTATTLLNSSHNGKTIRAYGTGKPIITGGKALTGWTPHPTLLDCFTSTSHTPLKPSCYIVTVDGVRGPMAMKILSYNNHGWTHAAHGKMGLVRDASGASATVGRFDQRNGELITNADIRIGGSTADVVSLVCRKDFADPNPRTNGYFAVQEEIDASAWDQSLQKFTFAAQYPVWATFDSLTYRRESFNNKGANGYLLGNPYWLVDGKHPPGAYAYDPNLGATVIYWPAGLSDLNTRAVEIGALNDSLFAVDSSTVSFRDLILEGTEMHRYTVKDLGTEQWKNDYAGSSTNKDNAGIVCTGTNGAVGSIEGCVFRNMPKGVDISGSLARKDVRNNLFRDLDFAGVQIGSSLADEIVEHNVFWWGFTFNRQHFHVRCGTSHVNLKIRYNHFHSSPGSAVMGNARNSDGYEFYRNKVDRCGRYGHDWGAHYLVAERTDPGTPSSGYMAKVYENLWDNCIGEAEFHHDTGQSLLIPKWESDAVASAYMDNGADYWHVDRNLIIGHSKSAISLNAFTDGVDGCSVQQNVIVCTAPGGLSDGEAYESLRVNQGWTPETGTIPADIDVTNNLFVVQNVDKSGQDFLTGSIALGTHRDNAVHQIGQPSGWSGEVVIASQADIWEVPGTPGAVKASCVAFNAPVSLWAEFQPGGAFWTEIAKAGFA